MGREVRRLQGVAKVIAFISSTGFLQIRLGRVATYENRALFRAVTPTTYNKETRLYGDDERYGRGILRRSFEMRFK